MRAAGGRPRLGVVVPARDEAELLPACLRALQVAVARVRQGRVPVVVVADGCTDGTAAIARAGGAVVVERGRAGVGDVGGARDAGVRLLLADAAADGVGPEEVWIATTDADSTVPPDWLVLQATAAAAGADALVGTVAVADWTGCPPPAAAAFERAYGAWRAAGGEHPHVHGANLGVRGSAYLAGGGFPPVPVGEDVALVRALEAVGGTVLRTPACPVRTSARRRPRARGGFGDDIDRLVTGLPGS
ncbi:glycosyltransferase [Geodermatophilus sp. YIM 151500]|uniref:glycosyltransferase n=1 Tax=Geodermatophilus sp. YIM 151500 TaxID=2984531 RepID=UPI0021E42341|nr:glycosyltransferase [Geodermatophilus sp. YIM 151500]MCV2491387.1 glycosyltransferase [Geodermatophilus sp. YIM 151500]